MFSETVASSLTGKAAPPPKKDGTPQAFTGYTPGIVTIIDMRKVSDQVGLLQLLLF